jgi:hypothetical protein
MKMQRRVINREDFSITDSVLLLFNEHDTKVALNWECDLPRSNAKENNSARS